MTKAEQIKMLETELKSERLEHEKAEAELRAYKKREERFVFVEKGGAVFSPMEGFSETFTVRSQAATYGAGVFDYMGFCKALDQFLNKWNTAAMEACLVNECEGTKKGTMK